MRATTATLRTPPARSADRAILEDLHPARLLVVSPCRNEATYLRRSAASVLAQSRRPDLWVIVDDGSTDETPAILAALAAEHDFIRVVRREDRGFRHVGPGVVQAFEAGLAAAGGGGDFDFLCKLDLDLVLPEAYFATLLAHMRRDPTIGTCSGKSLIEHQGRRRLEGQGDDMSLGMAKLYRRQCFEEIGGLVPTVMWDGIDCHRARMAGWQARSWDDPDINFLHLRPMGASHHGLLVGRFRHGRGQYFMGTSFGYMLVSAINWMRHPPLLLGGCAMLAGWLWGAVQADARYSAPGFRAFLRRYHWLVLRHGKDEAMRRIVTQR